MTNPLLVFALAQESRGLFDKYNPLYTGVGKVNAAYALTKSIAAAKPKAVINLGSAGSAVHKAGSVVCCTKFIQRDMDVTPLGFAAHQTPFEDGPVIYENGQEVPGLPTATCGTGDAFETAHIGEAYDVVDMEGYALAKICAAEGIPFTGLKYISDGADGSAHQDWEAALEDGAQKLLTQLQKILASA